MKNKEVDLLNWELELYEYLCLNLMVYVLPKSIIPVENSVSFTTKIKLPIHNYGLL